MTHLIILAAAIVIGLLLAWRSSRKPSHNPRQPDLSSFARAHQADDAEAGESDKSSR